MIERIFEINTRVWLNELRVKLGDVPGEEFKKIKSLDFVPNHLALDHPFVSTEPDLFINGTQEDLFGLPQSFFFPDLGRNVLAYGKDPYYPTWSDGKGRVCTYEAGC